MTVKSAASDIKANQVLLYREIILFFCEINTKNGERFSVTSGVRKAKISLEKKELRNNLKGENCLEFTREKIMTEVLIIIIIIIIISYCNSVFTRWQ